MALARAIAAPTNNAWQNASKSAVMLCVAVSIVVGVTIFSATLFSPSKESVRWCPGARNVTGIAGGTGNTSADLPRFSEQQQERQEVQLQQLHQHISSQVKRMETLGSNMAKDQQQALLQLQKYLDGSKLSEVQQQLQQQVEKMQIAAQEVKEYGQQLRQGFQQLGSTPPNATQQGAAQVQQTNQGNTTKGIICTVMRNEAKYVVEWVAFHLIVGASKIVIYDDSSTDGLAAAVAPFGDAVHVIRIKAGVNGVPSDLGSHRAGHRQDWSFEHCKKHYANEGFVGWFGIWDVDEFVFPCRRPAMKLQGNPLWDAWTNTTKPGSDGHLLRCTLFGVNSQDKQQPPGQLVLINNVRRAPDPVTEALAAARTWEAVKEGCDKCGCCQVSGAKTIYNISKVVNLSLSTHTAHNAVIDASWGKPYDGLCCNHYQFKSTDESLEKATANLNSHYEKVAKTEDAKKHLTMVPDHLIWQYLPDLLQLLQAKGIKYDVPPIKEILSTEGKPP